jgi:hypothetical protein
MYHKFEAIPPCIRSFKNALVKDVRETFNKLSARNETKGSDLNNCRNGKMVRLANEEILR